MERLNSRDGQSVSERELRNGLHHQLVARLLRPAEGRDGFRRAGRVQLHGPENRGFKLIFFEGLLLVVTGLILGVVGALALRGTLANELYGVVPTDPVIIGLVVALLGGIAPAASVVPARRATRVNPVTFLNQQ